jgi:hypothetical protein
MDQLHAIISDFRQNGLIKVAINDFRQNGLITNGH